MELDTVLLILLLVVDTISLVLLAYSVRRD